MTASATGLVRGVARRPVTALSASALAAQGWSPGAGRPRRRRRAACAFGCLARGLGVARSAPGRSACRAPRSSVCGVLGVGAALQGLSILRCPAPSPFAALPCPRGAPLGYDRPRLHGTADPRDRRRTASDRAPADQQPGRHPNNTIQLLDKIVSKEHCILELRDGRFFLRDLGSLNGTYINGERVRGETLLKHGDEIALGSTRARYDDGSGVAPSPPPARQAPAPSQHRCRRSRSRRRRPQCALAAAAAPPRPAADLQPPAAAGPAGAPYALRSAGPQRPRAGSAAAAARQPCAPPPSAARRAPPPAEPQRHARRHARRRARHRHADRRADQGLPPLRPGRATTRSSSARLRAPAHHLGAHARHRPRARPRPAARQDPPRPLQVHQGRPRRHPAPRGRRHAPARAPPAAATAATRPSRSARPS